MKLWHPRPRDYETAVEAQDGKGHRDPGAREHPEGGDCVGMLVVIGVLAIRERAEGARIRLRGVVVVVDVVNILI